MNKLATKNSNSPFSSSTNNLYDVELEQGLLGALIWTPDQINSLDGLNLLPEHFYESLHQQIFAAIKNIHNEGKPIDFLAVRNALVQEHGKLSKGDQKYIADLSNVYVDAEHTRHHAEMIVELALHRDILYLADALKQSAQSLKKPTVDIVNDFVRKAFEITDIKTTGKARSLQELLPDFLDRKNKRQQSGGFTGIDTGLNGLNQLINGWNPKNLYIVGGRPGMGKTSFLLNCLVKAAEDCKNKGDGSVMLFSLEMGEDEILERMVSRETDVPQAKIRNANLAEGDWNSIYDGTNEGRFGGLPIIIDTTRLTIEELKIKARKKAKTDTLKAIFVDYLQIIELPEKTMRRNLNKTQEIGYISRELKKIASELNVPVIAAAQLSRHLEQRGGNCIPQLSDLRDSGAIEQDADTVMFLWRPEYYGLTEDENGNSTHGLVGIFVKKNRQGRTGRVDSTFTPEVHKFSERYTDKKYVEPNE